MLATYFTGTLWAQEPAAAPGIVTPPSLVATSTIRGHIADQTGAYIPGATVTVSKPDGTMVSSVTADATGVYVVSNLAEGNYIVKATFEGFAPFSSPAITLAAGQPKRVDISMAIEAEQQSVTVTDDSAAVTVDATNNTSAIILKDKDLDALSDDPDELSNELTALAGPSAGPNGGQIYIDGFSGGQLPPKSAIREIRINQNPFSAEFDRLGYGRIEILTKPGTDKLHGRFFIQGNDKSFNTGNPFTSTIPDYYSYQFNATLNGSLSKKASFFVSAEQRNTENVNAWRIPDAVIYDATNGWVNIPDYGVNLLNRRIRDNVSVRTDWQLGSKNTLTIRYGYWSESEHGNLNQNSLASTSTHESNYDHTVQLSDAIILNDHAVNETRLQYELQSENHYPDSQDRTINVQGDFTGGGYPGQTSRDHATRLEFWNITTLSHGAHAIKFGTRLRDSRDANYTNGNFNGAFTFGTYQSYLNMATGLAAGTAFSDLVTQGEGPATATYTTGTQSSLANMFDIALFAQDDWKVSPRLTLSGGLRWEAQNHTADHNDWAPRLSLAWAIDGGKNKKAKTVLRTGYGFFYDRLDVRSLLTINRANLQRQVVLVNPTCTSTATTLSEIDLATCSSTGGSSAAAARVRYEVAPGFHAPYTGQAGLSLERQLTAGTSMTLTYLHSFGVHQLVTRNANQDSTNGTPQDSTGDYLYQYYPEAVFKQNQLIASVNANLSKKFGVNAFYTLSWADTNGAGGSASDAYNLDRDYGRAGFVSRNSLFMMANYSGPWGLKFNPFLVAQSGRPFNITMPTDPLNNFYNQRPTFATAATPLSDQVATPYGIIDSTGQTGTTIPINLGMGPAAVALNLRISRSVGIGPKLLAATANQTDGGPPPGGPPPGGGGPGGGRGGPGGGGFGPGGFGGGPGRGGMFGAASSDHKYTLNFSVQALNLFNDINYGQPLGTITSPSFNRSTSLAQGIFSTGSAARRIFGQVVFSF